MGPIEAVQTCFAKSFSWEGRASRAEFWWFSLAMYLVMLVVAWGLQPAAAAIHSPGTGVTVYTLLMLVILFPSIAVMVRRLHDTNRNGGWFWISFVPLIGGLILFVFTVTPGDPYANRYGPNPYATLTSPPGPYPGAAPGQYQAPMPGAPGGATIAERPPVTTPGLHWCATQGCPMYQTNVGRDVCGSCGNPTQETEPR